MTILCDRCVARHKSGHIKQSRVKAARWYLWPDAVAPAHLCTGHVRQLAAAFPNVAGMFRRVSDQLSWPDYERQRQRLGPLPF